MILEIEKVNNGFILTQSLDFEEKNETQITVYEICNGKDEKLEELKAFRRLVYDLQEYLGIFNSKHEKFNLEIKITENKNKYE